MWRAAGFAILVAGCSRDPVGIGPPDVDTNPDDPASTGFASGPWEQPTTPAPDTTGAQYEGAYVRILSPAPDEVVRLDHAYPFVAGVYAADGSKIEPSSIQWSASDDPDFVSDEIRFVSNTLAAGVHDLTVTAELPDGDRLTDTIGGVRVQSYRSGTYSGLFSVEGSVQKISISCTGNASIVLDVEGTTGSGDGSCVVSLLGANIPMNWTFDLDASGPELDGTASVELVGIFTYDLPLVSGTIDPAGDGLSLDFDANIPFIGDITGSVEAPRISLDTE